MLAIFRRLLQFVEKNTETKMDVRNIEEKENRKYH